MEFIIKKHVLSPMLAKTKGLVMEKDLKPVLCNFYLEVMSGTLRLMGTDMSLSVVASTSLVEIKEEGRTLLPGKLFDEVVKSIDAEDIRICVKEGKADIYADEYHSSMVLSNANMDEYPSLPNLSEAVCQALDRKEFLSAFAKILVAVSRDVKRPQMQLVNIQNGCMVATDGAQYQEAQISYEGELLLTLSVAEELVRVLRISEESVFHLGEVDDYIAVRIGEDEFIGQKTVEKFQSVCLITEAAAKNDQKLAVSRASLLAAIKRCRIMANPETNVISMELDENRAVLRCEDKYGNFATESLDVYWVSPHRIIGANALFLYNLIESNSGDDVTIFLGVDVGMRKSYLALRDGDEHLAILTQANI